jgi:hypothetical protein
MQISTLSGGSYRPVSPETNFKGSPSDDPRSEFPFDLAVLDTAREMYFLPHMDRLAGYLAGQTDRPLQVRVEAENQVIEYTLTSDPTQPIEANLNGTPYRVTSQPAQDGSLALTGTSAAGDFEGNFYVNPPDGTQVTGIAGPNRMPVNHSLWKVQNPRPGDPALEAMGSFACARMSQDYYVEGDNLHMMGNLGVHNVDAILSKTDNGWLLEGEFGDMHFRQTFRPVSPDPGTVD